MKFSQHPLSYTLLPALLLILSISFYRFIVVADYNVEYEGECDPVTQSCFVGCEDEECTEEYYYSIIERHAIDIRNQCGPDITECAAAQICLEGEVGCEILYCDSESLPEDESCDDVEGGVESDEVEMDTRIDGEVDGPLEATPREEESDGTEDTL